MANKQGVRKGEDDQQPLYALGQERRKEKTTMNQKRKAEVVENQRQKAESS